MQKNEQKARAHLARAVRLLKSSDRDFLGFGTGVTNLNDLGRDNLSRVLSHIPVSEATNAMSVSKNFATAGQDNIDRLRGGSIMKHHRVLQEMHVDREGEGGTWRTHTDTCMKELERLWKMRYIFTVEKDRFINDIRDSFADFYDSEPPPLTVIDFTISCVLKYPIQGDVAMKFVFWSCEYLERVAEKFMKSYVSGMQLNERDYIHKSLNLLEINYILDIIESIYSGYKSSVTVIDYNDLADELKKVKGCRRTFMVTYSMEDPYTSCLFVDASKSRKDVFIIDSPPRQELALLRDQLNQTISEDSNYTFYHLDIRTPLKDRQLSGAFAIEDSVRLFLNPEVPHLPRRVPRDEDEKSPDELDWRELPISPVKHKLDSHLLPYSQRFYVHNLRQILGVDSKYMWTYYQRYRSCFIDTYHWLYKLLVLRKVYLDTTVK